MTAILPGESRRSDLIRSGSLFRNISVQTLFACEISETFIYGTDNDPGTCGGWAAEIFQLDAFTDELCWPPTQWPALVTQFRLWTPEMCVGPDEDQSICYISSLLEQHVPAIPAEATRVDSCAQRSFACSRTAANTVYQCQTIRKHLQ